MRVHERTRAPGFLAKNDRVDAAAITSEPAFANSSQHAASCAKSAPIVPTRPNTLQAH